MIKDILNLLFPNSCLGCNTLLLRNENTICLLCRDSLPFTQEHNIPENASMNKFYGKILVEHVACLMFYSKGGIVQQLIHNMKYKNHPKISYFLGQIYAAQLAQTDRLKDVTTIIPVPLHRSKLRSRGYNQVDGFAKAISERFNIGINKKLLIKTLQTSSQTTKSRFQRKYHKKEIFDINISQLEYDTNHFLLLDDILTTGNTLEACCKKLLQIPNTKITILCLARSI
ncbi:ComF family protein [Myroides sp. M-43]|uniref:ComF family protein n=1 Tax=Myroides oncorhynchi TaxID=2893756 RepID=UPI001E599BD5|nr:ComF family protein [Myroides oncorhynchi]MCC9041987.1 ComF family protein [Myroides oncorhynchi]